MEHRDQEILEVNASPDAVIELMVSVNVGHTARHCALVQKELDLLKA
jgi:hypothetical protein